MVLNRVPVAKGVVHALAPLPALWIGLKIYEVAQTGNGLGADPVAAIEHFLGLWALRLLMLTLAITPLRQLTNQPVLVRFRRMLGLYAFFYASVHFSAYLVLDLRGYWTTIFAEIAKRPYITVGFTAWLLLLPLAITPLRQLTGQAVLVRFRRMLGLWTFTYATLHFSAYLVLDLRGYWATIFEEIAKRPYITVGFTAWLLLLPLAITSTTGWIRRLGRNWARLHKLVYAAGVLAVLHFWWLVKSDVREPALYAGILAVLLGWRAWNALKKRKLSARRKAAAG